MKLKDAIEICENFNDGYTFAECEICSNFNEKDSCCNKKKCDNLKAIERVLQELEKLQQEIKALKKGIASLMASRKKWKNRYYNLKANKIIDEMANYLANSLDCPLEMFGLDMDYMDCENRCNEDIEKDCWKQYFKKKVEEN